MVTVLNGSSIGTLFLFSSPFFSTEDGFSVEPKRYFLSFDSDLVSLGAGSSSLKLLNCECFDFRYVLPLNWLFSTLLAGMSSTPRKLSDDDFDERDFDGRFKYSVSNTSRLMSFTATSRIRMEIYGIIKNKFNLHCKSTLTHSTSICQRTHSTHSQTHNQKRTYTFVATTAERGTFSMRTDRCSAISFRVEDK